MEPTQDFSELVERLIHTKNYRELDLSFIERLVSNAAKASSDEKEILKSVKHAIHQAVNAFRVGEDSYRDLAIQLGDHAIHDRPVEERQLYAADFLRRHASSKERLPFIRRYYQEIFSGLPPIRSILDLGCGLNPIAAVSFIPNGRAPRSGVPRPIRPRSSSWPRPYAGPAPRRRPVSSARTRTRPARSPRRARRSPAPWCAPRRGGRAR